MKKYLAELSILAASLAAIFPLSARAAQTVDANNDGVISGDEASTAFRNNKPQREMLFMKLDTDHNGVLTPSEIGKEANLQKLDTDNNGDITEPEFLFEVSQGAAQRSAKLDANNNGQIDSGETSTAVRRNRTDLTTQPQNQNQNTLNQSGTTGQLIEDQSRGQNIDDVNSGQLIDDSGAGSSQPTSPKSTGMQGGTSQGGSTSGGTSGGGTSGSAPGGAAAR